ncbi:MAG: hypothetical protein HY825_13675 [Acidobacteria bacterium]|nr:hypothetical protein [Acidobacteriota bacterium]
MNCKACGGVMRVSESRGRGDFRVRTYRCRTCGGSRYRSEVDVEAPAARRALAILRKHGPGRARSAEDGE